MLTSFHVFSQERSRLTQVCFSDSTPGLNEVWNGIDEIGYTTSAIMSAPRKAVIVGAGPVGCLTAISLAKMGWAVEIYEGRPGM